MNYDLLNLGDSVLTINSDFVAIERNDGSVDLFRISICDNAIHIDTATPTTIGYTSSPFVESYETENGVHVIKF